MRSLITLTALMCGSIAIGCDREKPTAPASTRPASPGAPAGPSGRIDVPDSVRRNLGLTFATAERRAVASTLRVPGRFELTPDARRESHVTLAGRVELLVKQYDRVKKGDVLYRLDSPDWRDRVLGLEETRLEITRARADVEIAEAHLTEARGTIDLTHQRIEALANVDVKRADLALELLRAQNALPRAEAELRAKRAALVEAEEHYPLVLSAAAALIGESAESLDKVAGESNEPRWRGISTLDVRAADDGVVESLAVTNGAWVDAGGLVLTTVQPKRVRFRASALQADLPRLRDGMRGEITAPQQSGPGSSMKGIMSLALTADADARTIDLIVTPETPASWARAGVSAFVDLTAQEAQRELAIPVGAIIQDGLTKVFYRRDRKNPDVVIRTEADLGVSDGRYVVVASDLTDGDEVVLDGIYEIKLASSTSAAGAMTGGHFHADGTWHADGEPEPGEAGGGK